MAEGQASDGYASDGSIACQDLVGWHSPDYTCLRARTPDGHRVMFQEISESGYYTLGTEGSEPRVCSRPVPREMAPYYKYVVVAQKCRVRFSTNGVLFCVLFFTIK